MGFIGDAAKFGAGIPGPVGMAAGVLGGIFGSDEEAPPPPQYTPYQYNQDAFMPSRESNMDLELQRRNLQGIAGGPNPGQTNQAGFNEALGEQRAAMLGQRPSLAEMQMRQGLGMNNAMAQSAAGSARGAGSLALAQMNAANQISNNNQQTNFQTGMLRAQEQENARQGMFGAVASDRLANTKGFEAQQGALGQGFNSLNAREGMRLNSAQALEQNRARENAAAQGQAYNTWSNNAAAAAQDKANTQTNQTNMMNTGVNAVTNLGAAGKLDGMFGGKK